VGFRESHILPHAYSRSYLTCLQSLLPHIASLGEASSGGAWDSLSDSCLLKRHPSQSTSIINKLTVVPGFVRHMTATCVRVPQWASSYACVFLNGHS